MIGAVADADDLSSAYESWRHGDSEAARRMLTPLADTGDSRAQLLLGMIHRDTNASVHDDGLALQWLLRAAQQGVAEAQFEVGLMYELGIGVGADAGEATYWYQQAIDQGSCPAELDPLERALTADDAAL